MRLIDILSSRYRNKQIFDNKQSKELLREITNEQLLQEIDTIFVNAQQALKEQRHTAVATTLTLLLSYDLLWRRVVGNQLINPQGPILSANKLNFVVLVQSYFNSFRTSLLVEIVNYLMTQGYNQITKIVKENVELATQRYSEVQTINNYYDAALKRWFAKQQKLDPDEHLEKIYFECREAFQEVKDTSIHVIRSVINKQLLLINPIIS